MSSPLVANLFRILYAFALSGTFFGSALYAQTVYDAPDDGRRLIRDISSAAAPEAWRAGPGFPDVARCTATLLAGGECATTRAVNAPGNLVKQKALAPDVRRFFYTRRILIPADDGAPLGLRLGSISDRDRTYLNGELIGGRGTLGASTPQAYDRVRLYPIPERLVRRNAENALVVLVESYFPLEAGISQDRTAIGPLYALQRELLLENFTAALFLAPYLAVGAYFLFLFIRRRESRENLLFGLFCFTLVLYQFLRTQLKFEFDIELITLKRMEYAALFFLPTTFYQFVRSYFALPASRFVRWFDRGMLGMAALAFASTAFVFASDNVVAWDRYNQSFFLPALLFAYLPSTFGLIIYAAFWRRDRDAMLILLGAICFVAAVVYDATGFLAGANRPRIMGYAFSVFVLSLALILANRFVRLHREVADLNRNLENKVEQRTAELQQTLGEVRALKEQQDGDYFLTSLLLRPLGGARTKSELFDVRSLEMQKKRFSFRGREYEIGGDLCVADDIRLRDRSYAVFLNGDAMGKSIQGAGGAIVLGALFKSILARTQARTEARARSPEQWLKESFLELHDVFAGFDGHMLASLLFGLLEENTGLLYYINAEHPYLALYRGGAASFIDPELYLRKVGVELDQPMRVQTFRFRPGDVVFAGSDGRDDILIGKSADGQRMINEDETLFLRAIEAARGDLDGVRRELLGRGELTDDLSLMRLAFREDQPLPARVVAAVEAKLQAARRLAADGETRSALAELETELEDGHGAGDFAAEAARILYRLRDFAGARRAGERALELGGGDAALLRKLGFACKALGDAAAALDYAERARLRDPADANNLINLADLHRLAGRAEAAREALELARRAGAEPERMRELETRLGRALP